MYNFCIWRIGWYRQWKIHFYTVLTFIIFAQWKVIFRKMFSIIMTKAHLRWSNTTRTVEVSSASVTVSTPIISVSNGLDGDRAVILITELEDRLNRMEDAIVRLGSTLERFINNSSSMKRGDDRSIRGYLTDFSVMLHSQKLMETPQMRKTILNNDVIGAAGMVILMLSSQQRKLKVDR